MSGFYIILIFFSVTQVEICVITQAVIIPKLLPRYSRLWTSWISNVAFGRQVGEHYNLTDDIHSIRIHCLKI